ncbi:hypothetical protein D3C84_1055310 [compost metagenome]
MQSPQVALDAQNGSRREVSMSSGRADAQAGLQQLGDSLVQIGIHRAPLVLSVILGLLNAFLCTSLITNRWHYAGLVI